MHQCIGGYNGERHDPITHNQHLNNGYRAYSNTLNRFTCNDSWSPFYLGGVNAYAYCQGDPVNREDPSGHMSWNTVTGVALGVIGLAMIPFTMGQSLTVMACIAAGLEAISVTAGIASAAIEENHPETSATLGWVSLATGILSAGSGFGTAGKHLINAVMAKGNQLGQAFRRGLSPMADDLVHASEEIRGGTAVASNFRLPDEFRILRRRYEGLALNRAIQHHLPQLGIKRVRVFRLPTLGDHVREVPGLFSHQPLPVYSHELRMIAPLPAHYKRLLDDAYAALQVPPTTFNFRLIPEPLPTYSEEDLLRGQLLHHAAAPPSYSPQVTDVDQEIAMTRM